MAFDHVMIDCETLDTKPGGVILSVGAVRFNPTSFGVQSYEDLLKNSFRRNFDLQTSIDLGFTISASTLTWWMGQSKEAQAASFTTDRSGVIYSGLLAFSEFFLNRDKVWANGANFDPAMLEAYFSEFKIPFPWAYNKIRCVRTVTSMNLLSANHPAQPPKVAHDPVADCIAQVQKLQSIAVENPNLIWS